MRFVGGLCQTTWRIFQCPSPCGRGWLHIGKTGVSGELPAGDYMVATRTPAGRRAEARVSVVPGEASDVVLRLD